MDMNKDAKLNYEEFKEGSKQDPTIVQVSIEMRCRAVAKMLITIFRLCRSTMVWCKSLG